MKHNLRLGVFLLALVFTLHVALPLQAQNLPQLGAEIYLEPGQTSEQIVHWVKALSDNKMPVARVFMMWNYVEPKPDVWDFAPYDTLFSAAERYGVKITVTLVPNSPPFWWGEKFFYTTHNMRMYENGQDREKAKGYIEKVVNRYKNSAALDSWWLYNEPSGDPHPDTLAVDEFRKWLRVQYLTIDSLNRSWQSYFPSFQRITFDPRWQQGGWIWQRAFYDWSNFWKQHINNQINWLGLEVRKYDSVHPFHTNPPGIFGDLAHYDLPGMKKLVNTLGGSLHPSWAFSFVPRNEYSMAVSWQNDLLYGITEEMPYWVSELQAGNNWFGPKGPLCPTPQDIAQWVWTSIGSGASRVIFWLLNARMQGNESAEWALLDFQQEPSERMLKARDISGIIQQDKGSFQDAKPVETPVTVIVSPQTLLLQERKLERLAHQKAAMACYAALMQQGIPVQLKLMSEYNWDSQKEGQVVILADVMCLTRKEIDGIDTFVHHGGKVVATGMTGLFDENEKTWVVNRAFPLSAVFGGSFKEIFSSSGDSTIRLDGFKDAFPSSSLYAQILPQTGQVVGRYHGKAVAIRNNYGDGSVLWIPSMIALGAWTEGSASLANLLKKETLGAIKDIPFHFDAIHAHCFMHTLKSATGYVSIIVNESESVEKIKIKSNKHWNSEVLYGKGWVAKDDFLTIDPHETTVIKWN